MSVMLKRRGFSDRGRLVLFSFIFFGVSLALTSYSAKHPKSTGIGHQAIAEITSPFESGTYKLYSWIISFWDRYVHLAGMEIENESLRSRLATLEERNAALEETQKENERLQQLLSIKDGDRNQTVAATVIGYDPSSWVQAVTLNKGSQSQITVGLPVVSGNGIVGQVIAVSPHTARVLLIIDRSSGVDVMIQESRARGILQGTGSTPCDYQFVIDSEEVVKGDKVVTSGLDGVFPKGLNVGVVTSVEAAHGLFKNIKVTPSVNFSKLEDVLVLLPSADRQSESMKPPPVEGKDDAKTKGKAKEGKKK